MPRRPLSRPARRALACTVVGLVGIGAALGHVAVAGAGEDPAQRAAREIQAARDRANAAAAAYTEAELELERLSAEAIELESELETLQAEVDELGAQVEQVAINSFMAAGSASIAILEGPEASTRRLVSNELVATATNSSTAALDDYAEARNDLEDKRDELEDKQDEVARQQERYEAAREQAEAEVVRLQEIEAQRLEDERVRRILEAQRAEELRQQQAAAAAAQAHAQRNSQNQNPGPQSPDPAPGVGTVTTAPSGQPQAPVAPAPSGGGTGGGGNGGVGTTAPPNTQPSNDGPAPTPAPPTAPPATEPPPTAPPRSGMICPVLGGSAYTDTWGASRSGGRSHQGVDMLASTGTPLVAVVSGSVTFKQTRLGGNSIWLAGNDGNRYFYAHLSGFSGSSRSVSQGEVIGYVGDTGNARGTPHLHFEVHPGGGAAVNPYGYVRQAGC
jgi:murein DD-endopeptidase MepM/ murein hydrolase activator NlpD